MNNPDSHYTDSIRGKKGFDRLVAATINSFKGLRAAWHHEAAFREECLLLCFLVPTAFWLGEDALQLALLLMSCLAVLLVELLNSAIEVTVDRVGLEHHELSGRAKDIASAAVFLSLAQLLVVWGLVAWHRFG